MLYCYTPEANKGNWLHACLLVMLRKIHRSVGNGDDPPEWGDLIPRKYADKLTSYTGLRDRIVTYTEAYKLLSPDEQSLVCQAVPEQNRIVKLLNGTAGCIDIDGLPNGIREPAKSVGSEAFRLLTKFGIRDQQYRRVYNRSINNLCPFCGLHPFDAPGEPREDLDHYLPRSRYPFAAANLRNLPPMCGRCNTRYKKDQDPILNGSSNRLAADPFGTFTCSVSLRNSTPFGRGKRDEPQWAIDLIPVAQETNTWDQVFSIRRRYERSHLNRDYETWLEEFGKWCRSAQLLPSSNDEVIDAVERYQIFKGSEGLGDRSFLKAAVFEMLLEACRNGDQRLISLLKLHAEQYSNPQ